MKVLHVVESLSSGVATALEAYVENRPAGTDHVVYGFRRPGVQVGDGIEASARVVELPAERTEQVRAVARALKSERPDVVHLHSSWAGLAVRSMRVPKNVRLVYTPHCYAFERQDLSASKRRAVRSIERTLARRNNVVAAVGVHEAELALDLDPRARMGDEVVVVPHTVPDRIRSELAELRRRDAEGRMVCVLGRLSPQKDVDFFLSTVRATNELTDRLGVERVEWTWVGGEDANVSGGSAGLTAKLERAGVRVTGWVDGAEALDTLARSWAYLHTAAWEGFPLGVVEAAELDLPIVMRLIASLEEVDLPTAGRDPVELAHRLVELDNPDLRRQAVNAVRRFRAGHQPDDQRRALARVYRAT